MKFVVDLDKRLDWDSYFMMQAYVTAARSSCIKRHVGCVVVNDVNRVVSCGYNGQVPGFVHCDVDTCARKDSPSGENLDLCRAVHAEQNAITYAAGTSTNLSGCKWYCTTMPCIHCFKLILSLDPKLIMFKEGYNPNMFQSIYEDLSRSKRHDNLKIVQVDLVKEVEHFEVTPIRFWEREISNRV